MKTLPKFVAAIAFAAGVSSALIALPLSPAVAADKEKEQPQVSKAVAKPLKAAQDSMSAKKYQEGIAKLKEVEAMSNRTPYDTHVMNELFAFGYARLNDTNAALKYLEPGLSDGFLPPAEVNSRLVMMSKLDFQAKDYDKALDFGNRALKAGVTNEDINLIIAQSYYIKADFKNARKASESMADADVKRGASPKENILQITLNSCIKLDDADCESRTLDRLVQFYPKQEYWRDVMSIAFDSKDANSDDRATLEVFRLALDVDGLNGASQYTEMAQRSVEAGSPGLAQQVLEKGFAKNVFTEARDRDRSQRLLDSAKKQAALDQANLPKLEQEAAAAKTGDPSIGLGIAYLSYGQYQKAVDAFNRGFAKGPVKFDAQAHLLLGIAQLKAGNKEEALKSFKVAKGTPAYERVATLWTYHARAAS
ncbi:MAG TPA: hypothetical protein VLW26_09375 [Steroidobacteraceae bacterium]|nr:hypothetical protein [Steroidobacteraceae bacterium]